MLTVEVQNNVDGHLGAAIGGLLAAAERAAGRPALSDHLAADLARRGDLVAVTATDPSGELVGYAQASVGNEAYAVEIVVDPAHLDAVASLGSQLLRAVVGAIGRRGGGRVNWFVVGPTAAHLAVADERGLQPTRRLLQMRRSLPTGMEATIKTRAFVPGADDGGVLEVNNRAFAGHAEQGGWTLDTLRHRQGEAWFDAGGLRVYERDGRIVAFCWTKVHQATTHEPQLGEIYVVAVHPDMHGAGLGRQMTLAGLDHLAGRGITSGMLWVDADNAVAVHLYERLGFTVVETTVVLSTTVPPG